MMLKTILNLKVPKDTDYGIEIEIETKSPYVLDPFPVGWLEHQDGSLRNFGKELVTKAPSLKSELSKKIEEIKPYLEVIDKQAKVIDSPRSSVHVHVNVSNLQPKNYINCLIAYWLLENTLMNYCGERRKARLFCLRLQDAASMGVLLRDRILEGRTFDFLKDFGEDYYKYGAINLSATNKYGSLEFRGMRGTVDTNIIHTWAKAMIDLVDNASTKFEDPAELMDIFYETSSEKFIELFFDKDFCVILKNLSPCLKDELNKNAMLLSQIAYGTDWNLWNAAFTKPKTKKIHDIYDELLDIQA